MKPPRHALWLVGEDIATSRSPAMHNAAMQAMGLTERYALRACDAGALTGVLDDAERLCRGINVTAPHKVAVAQRYASACDAIARATGAVNTVVYGDDGPLLATNTDVHGLRRAWHRAALQLEGRHVAVVGAGGAARAAVIALADAGAAAVQVIGRDPDRARALRTHAEAHALATTSTPTMVVIAAPDVAVDVLAGIGAGGVVHDLRYGVHTHALRNAALRAGHFYLDGTSMLVEQGLQAAALFLGESLPEEARLAFVRAAVSRS